MIRYYKIFKLSTRKTEELSLEISKPIRNGDDYLTKFSLDSASICHSESVYGIDEIQSLFLCLMRVGDFLYTLEKNEGMSVFWFEEGDDLGLPYSPSVNKMQIKT